jgi:hypothetical protein
MPASKIHELLLQQLSQLSERSLRSPGTLLDSKAITEAQSVVAAHVTMLNGQKYSKKYITREADILFAVVKRLPWPAAIIAEQTFGPLLSPEASRNHRIDNEIKLLAMVRSPLFDFSSFKLSLAQYQRFNLISPVRKLNPFEQFVVALAGAVDAHQRGSTAPAYDWLVAQLSGLSASRSYFRPADLFVIFRQCIRQDSHNEKRLLRLIDWIQKSPNPHRWDLFGTAAVDLESNVLISRLVAAGMPLSTRSFWQDESLLKYAINREAAAPVAALRVAGANNERPSAANAPRRGTTPLPLLTALHDPNSFLSDLSGSRLQVDQLQALSTVRHHAQHASAQAKDGLMRRLSTLGYSEQDYLRVHEFIAKDADLVINFKDATGFATSNVYLPSAKPEVRGGEARMFAEAYKKNSQHTVKYGTLNAARTRRGCSLYGHCMLLLHDAVRGRTTLRQYTGLTKTNRPLSLMGDLQFHDHILFGLSDRSLRQVIAASSAEKSSRPLNVEKHVTGTLPGRNRAEAASAGTGIILPAHQALEIQVHGPIEFSRDVRKVVVPRSAIFSSIETQVPIELFVETYNLPLRLRDGLEIPTKWRVETLHRLNNLGWDVGAWTVMDGNYDILRFPTTLPTTAPGPTYTMREQFYQAESGIPSFDPGTHIVGYHADPKTGSAWFMLQHRPDDTAVPDYAMEKTTALAPTLRRLEQAGRHVAAYAQLPLTGVDGVEHVIITAEGKQNFAHRLRTAADQGDLHNLESMQKKEGFVLCGLAHGAPTGFTCIFRRATSAHQEAPQWSLSAEQTERILALSPTTAMGEPITTVPEELLFITSSGHAFDVLELTEYITKTTDGLFKNWWTQQELSESDVRALLQHPSGAGKKVMHLRLQSEAARAVITQETANRVGAAAKTILAADATEDTTAALFAAAELAAYIDSRPAEEQMALQVAFFDVKDTHAGDAPSRQSVMGALGDMQSQSRTSCFHKPADFLVQMSQALLSR